MSADTSDTDTSDTPQRAAEAPTAAEALNAWLNAQLGRPLVLVALCRAGASEQALAGWRAQLQQFPQVSLALEEAASDEPIMQTLMRIARRDPDALLVCDDVPSDDGQAQRWRAALLDAAEGLNLFERTQIALLGEGMTRAAARKLGFEDGFALERPLGEALAVLAREAVTREAYRRYGSSPPCYL